MIIETGADIDGADSFIDVASFDVISVNYQSAALTQSDAIKEAALRRAFLFMRSLNWIGSFPTFEGTIPDAIKTAQGLLAYHEVSNPNTLQPNVTTGQQRVLNKVGEIGWQVTAASGVDSQRAQVMIAMDLLQPYLDNNTNFLRRA